MREGGYICSRSPVIYACHIYLVDIFVPFSFLHYAAYVVLIEIIAASM